MTVKRWLKTANPEKEYVLWDYYGTFITQGTPQQIMSEYDNDEVQSALECHFFLSSFMGYTRIEAIIE